MKSIIYFAFVLAIFSGCSSKQYYNPKDTQSFELNKETITLPSYIKSINSSGATTRDNRIINNFGLSSFKLKDGYEYINSNNSTIISGDKNGNIFLSDTNQTINFSSNAIGAAKKENLLALTFSDNSFGIWDIKENKFKLKEYLENSFVNDTKFAMPVILNKITLFPTLDGKIVIVENETLKITRTLSIDLQSEIKNVTLLQTVGDVLVGGTGNKIISLNKGKFNSKDMLIQNYFVDEDFIYLALIDGSVLKLDFDLNIISQTKFKFAKFHAIALDKEKNIFLLESGGYIIKLSNDFKNSVVDSFPFYEDEKVFVSKNKIYFENKLLQFD